MEVINAIGRRKAAIARVFVKEGKGDITINGRELANYFPSSMLQFVVNQPLNTVNAAGKYDIKVNLKEIFYLPESRNDIDFSAFDYVVDAIDTVSGKIELIMKSEREKTRIISSMGAGNKLDPTAFRVGDISETTVCPLARIIRKECKKRGIRRLKVVYSTEDPIKTTLPPDDPAWAELPEGRNALPGSVCFVPAVAGMIIAGEVIKDIIGNKGVNCMAQINGPPLRGAV